MVPSQAGVSRQKRNKLPDAQPGMLCEFNPLQDPRWLEFLSRHPAASVFHTPEWLRALQCTYGYKPLVLTTCPPGTALSNGVVFCEIHSWLTGVRLVSLPFSDHCEPLADSCEELRLLLRSVIERAATSSWKYVEIRPVSAGVDRTGFEPGDQYWLHTLDLSGSCDEIFKGFHKDCVRRRIRHAERQPLTYEEGRSESLLCRFYQLLLLTRRRHYLPPQPLAWFRNLLACLGDMLKIRMLSIHGAPIASIVTIRYRDCMTYKYGCSDPAFNNLGGVALLFWRAVQEAKAAGLRTFDMGRSDLDNHSLVLFKDRWRATRIPLTYGRYPTGEARVQASGWKGLVMKRMFQRLPDSLLIASGKLLYRHMG
jgi:GNAT acetyltransferase-like protein